RKTWSPMPNQERRTTKYAAPRTTARIMNPRYFNFFIALLLIAGCAVGPNYRRPKVIPPATFRGSTNTVTNSFGDLPWWEVFHDENLQHLIRVALTNNYDLRIAIARVDQAREIIAEN